MTPKMRQTGLAPLLTIIATALVVGGLLILSNKIGLYQKTAKPRPDLALSANETTNWNTYTNAKYGFTFKYPNDLIIRTGSTDDSIGFLERSNDNSSQKLRVSVTENLNNLDLKTFLDNNKPIPDDRINISYEQITVNGYEGILETYELPCLGICENIKNSNHFTKVIKGDGFIVSFNMDTRNQEGNTKNDEEWLDNILSTFKFLDQ